MTRRPAILTIIVCTLATALPAVSNGQQAELVAALKGASVVAQDDGNTFLGKIDNEFARDSIFNEFSKYGGKFSSTSIFNEFGRFGGEFSRYSPFNEFTTKPPMIIKDGKVLGYLTANKFVRGGISVAVLQSLKKEF